MSQPSIATPQNSSSMPFAIQPVVVIAGLKGGIGKTVDAEAIARAFDALILTNDQWSPIDKRFPKGQVLKLKEGQMPPVVPPKYAVVADFGGYADKRLIATIAKSHVTIVPFIRDDVIIETQIKTLMLLTKHTDNIIIVVNKAKKGKLIGKDKRSDLEFIRDILKNIPSHPQFAHYPITELCESQAFVQMQRQGKSVRELANQKINMHWFAKPADQVDVLCNLIRQFVPAEVA